ncbi:MAG TPA: prepilin-type N-terminal cleavage/methylation domain-containing protein [Verrucomicrobiae bacterium]|nr:prepilin-type N-terminal cleavage/methylation domain-containing protein [Verrucomicrobiae bacterium]
MGTTMTQPKGLRAAARHRGFTLIECAISMAVLTIGSVSLLGVFGLAVQASQTSQENMLARQLASEAMESIYTARNESEISWAQIQNVSNGGIFTDGLVNVMCAGPDGIIGTADDTSCLTASGAVCPNGGIECLTDPGPDGILGTADDVILSLSNYQRQILITPLYTTGSNPTLIQTLEQVSVTISYTVPQTTVPKTYTLTEYVSEYH